MSSPHTARSVWQKGRTASLHGKAPLTETPAAHQKIRQLRRIHSGSRAISRASGRRRAAAAGGRAAAGGFCGGQGPVAAAGLGQPTTHSE